MSSASANRLSEVAGMAEGFARALLNDWNPRGRVTLNGLGVDDLGFTVAERCSRYYGADFFPSKPLVRRMTRNLIFDELETERRRERVSRFDELPIGAYASRRGMGHTLRGGGSHDTGNDIDDLVEHYISISVRRFREGSLERRTLDLMRSGVVKPCEIADDLQVPRKSIYNAIQKIRKFLASRPLPCALPRYW